MPTAETTTNRKKKTSRRKTARKTKTYTAEEVAEMVEGAKKTAFEEAETEFEQRRLESEFADDVNTEDAGAGFSFGADPQMSFEEGGHAEELVNAFDLFEHVQQNFSNHGTLVLYQVKKDGQFMGEHYHPITWSQLQKKYGGGHYTVLAKRAADKTYIKQQTQLLADVPTNNLEERPQEAPTINVPPAPVQDSAALVKTVMETFTRLNELKSDEKARTDRDERKADSTFNTTFLTILTQQQENSQKMFMEMQRNTQDMMKSISENFSKSQEKAEEKFTRMIEKLNEQSNKKESFGTMELISLMKDAEDRGWSKMETLMALADAKAEEKSDNDNSDSGMIGKLIGGIVPMLSTANQAQQMQLQNQMANQQQRPPQPRHHLPPQRAEQRQAQRPPQRPRPAARSKGVGLPTFDLSRVNKNKAIEPEVIEPETVPPAENWDDAQVVEPTTINAGSEETPQVNESLDDILKVATPAQQAIAQVAVPRIATNIFDEKRPAAVTASEVLNDVVKAGGTKEVLLDQFPFDFMLRIARAFGVGPEKDQWFEEFYAYINNPTGMDTTRGSQPTQSDGNETAGGSSWKPGNNQANAEGGPSA